MMVELRAATWPSHQRLEKRLDVKARFRELRAYRAHLEKMWGFCAHIEQSLAPGSFGVALPDYESRRKLPLLTQDLAALGGDGGCTAALARCRSLPARWDTAAALGCVYVLEGAANVVRTVTPAGLVTTIAGVLTNSGSAVAGNVDGTGAAAQFNTPVGLAIDSSSNAILIESFDMRKVTPVGVVTTVAGSGASAYVDGAASMARFASPNGIAFDASGNAYVSDGNGSNTCAIRMIAPTGAVSTLAGGGLCGFADGTGPAAKFNQPAGLVVDSAGNVIVADRGTQTIRKITPAGVVTTIAGLAAAVGWADGTGAAARFAFPNQISFDAAGNLWVLDQSFSAIRIITSAGLVSTFAYEPGYFSFNGYTPPSTAKSLPSVVSSMLVNPAGGVYVGIGCAIEKIGP